jgi:hypothetical protein
MGSPFQQRALRRKVVYIVLIVVLFTAAMLFRSYAVEPQGRALALRDTDVGEVELSGRAVQLSLTGLRGWASCILWHFAMELQKKNQWDELETAVRSITKLQPHFITPWLFQSWNLSYNVAVQCDLPRDKYYYISRGVDLLAEGERQNQFQPELRFAMGTYYQQKISMADNKIPLQTLFEMSSIDPLKRQSRWFWAYETDEAGRPKVKVDKYLRPVSLDVEGREVARDQAGRPVDAKGKPVVLDKEHRPRFEVFCEQHPRLARRLREQLGFATEKQAVTWLDENLKIPSLYGERVEGEGSLRATRLKLNKEGPFPVLPPPDNDPEKYDPVQPPSLEALTGDWDAFAGARVWYAYAQEALPPANPDLPGQSERPIRDPIHHREPQHMTTIIFRNYPPRAQAYVAERLEEEGWYDAAGWKLAGWFPGDRYSTGEPAVVGTGREWAPDAWRKAYEMWKEHGARNHILYTREQLRSMQEQTKLYRETYNVAPGQEPRPLRPVDQNNEAMIASFKMYIALKAFDRAQQLSNFHHFYVRADVEKEPETVRVRKALYEAEQLRKAGKAQALPKYEAALKDWASILQDNVEFRKDEEIQEDSYEAELNYVQLLADTPEGRLLKQQLFVQAFLGQALAPSPGTAWLSLAKAARPQAVAPPVILGPLDRDDPTHQPLGPVQVVLQSTGAQAVAPAGAPAGPAAWCLAAVAVLNARVLDLPDPLIPDTARDTVMRRKGLIHTPAGPPPGAIMQQGSRMRPPPGMLGAPPGMGSAPGPGRAPQQPPQPGPAPQP